MCWYNANGFICYCNGIKIIYKCSWKNYVAVVWWNQHASLVSSISLFTFPESIAQMKNGISSTAEIISSYFEKYPKFDRTILSKAHPNSD